MESLSHRIAKFPLVDIPASLPNANIPGDVDHVAVAESILRKLPELDAHLLTADAWWRDLLIFTGTLRSFYSPERILPAWNELTGLYPPSSFSLIPDSSRIARFGPDVSWIEASFTFDVARQPPCKASAIIRIVPDGNDGWKICLLTTMLEEIIGLGNPDVFPSSMFNPVTTNGTRENGDHQESCDAVIAGAGMAGLSIAARLKALGVSSVAVETNDSIGGNWTGRYDSVRLHTSKESGQMPFERTWGDDYGYFLSGKDLAEGFQKFAKTYKLDIRLSTTVTRAQFDDESKTWTISLSANDGSETTITARHLILAMGAGGQVPKVPYIPNVEQYKGTLLHSKDYKSPKAWSGQKGAIIGTANTAHDVAEDMLAAGLSPVTMVQRNATPMLPLPFFKALYDPVYNLEIPVDVADRSFFHAPIPVSRQLALHFIKANADKEPYPEYYEGLEKAGFKTERYIDLMHILYERMGGHYFDVGASAKVIRGDIKMKSDAAIAGFTPTGLEFANGSKLDADVIIYATGFEGNMRSVTEKIVGSKVAEQLEDFWQVDAEGELLGVWKPMRHPNIWYTGGTIGQARFFARFLAIQIKAEIEGVSFQVYDKYRASKCNLG